MVQNPQDVSLEIPINIGIFTSEIFLLHVRTFLIEMGVLIFVGGRCVLKREWTNVYTKYILYV